MLNDMFYCFFYFRKLQLRREKRRWVEATNLRRKYISSKPVWACCSFQPVEVWRRKARIVRMLCGVCKVLRQYALEAGLMTNIVLPTTNRRRTTGDRGDVVEFCVDDFKVQKEVKPNVLHTHTSTRKEHEMLRQFRVILDSSSLVDN